MNRNRRIITHGIVALSLTVSSVAHASAADALLKVFRPILGVQVATDYPSADAVDAAINDKNQHVVRETGTVVITQADAAEYGTTVAEVYGEMKSAIDELNIFTDSTRVYLPEGTLHKDDIIAVSTNLVSGIISTSYEDVAEYIEEAFERCGLEVRTGYDLKTARRSMNLMLAEWANRGLNQWTIEQRTQTVTADDVDYSLGTDVIDILSAVVRRSGTDFSLSRISRDSYLSIPNKTTTGRPTQFFLDRQITPNLKIWPAPENSTDVIHYDALTRIQDADGSVNTLEIPFRFYPCLTAGLAYYISLKKNPNLTQMLKAIYEEEFERAMGEDRDRSSFTVTPEYSYLRSN